ncbi:MAG: alcohol dehydrogenase catalytic domain-containing protein [Myxococcota bacterium]
MDGPAWALRLDDEAHAVSDHVPALRPGEATVALRLGGVCATDLELVRGYMGFRGVLGHEFVGEVLEAPGADDLRGKRVVGDINCPCGTCPTCRAGRPTHCPSRTVLGIDQRDGAFAERFSLPVGNLHVVPDAVPDDAAVFVEPLAAALEILEQVHVAPSTRAVVLGVGRLGQLVARVLALAGAEVAGVGRSAQRLALLPPGVTAVPADRAEALAGADLVVDCTGSRDGLALATRLVRPRGTVVMKTTVHDPAGISPIPWVLDEVRLVGSRCGPFAPALRLLAAGAVDPRPLIGARFPLARGAEALAAAASGAAVKVVITPS